MSSWLEEVQHNRPTPKEPESAMSELLRSLGRKVAIVNLDLANENIDFTPDF